MGIKLADNSSTPTLEGKLVADIAKNGMRLSQSVLKERRNLLAQYTSKANGILHLGANRGQEASAYHEKNIPVLWVEAIPAIHSVLEKHIQQFPDQRSCCGLLTNENGRQYSFNISNNDSGASSSIYQFGDYANGDQSLWPGLGLKMIDRVTLCSIKLDSLLTANSVGIGKYNFWVVDLQGAELEALKGAEKALKHCMALTVEVSEVEVYKGAVLWPEIRDWLESRGFIAQWKVAKPHDEVLFVRQ